jgi:hypothetical protein
MKTFINKTLTELSNNSSLKSNTLLKVLTESTKNSMVTNPREVSLAYNTLKNGIVDLNKHLKNKDLNIIIEQFTKFEYTDSNRVYEIGKELNLNDKLSSIQKSDAYSDPMIMHKVIQTEEKLKDTPEFMCYEFFINVFSNAVYENVKACVKEVSDYVEKNKDRILVLESIHMMKSTSPTLYVVEIEKLSKMLITEQYSSKAIKYKLNYKLPIINALSNKLSILEASREHPFSMGNGNSKCSIQSVISPSIKIGKSSVLLYMDDKFIALTQKNLKSGTVLSESKNSKVYQLEENYIKDKYNDFYKLCESFYKLQFSSNLKGNGIVSNSIRNFSLEFKTEDSKNLDMYINESKVADPSEINFVELLVLESNEVKERVNTLLKSIDSIFNFEFIKTLVNESTSNEINVMELNGDFHICEKPNKVERFWKNNINEYKLYNYVLENFNYDISPIFKVKINEQVSTINDLNTKKEEIENNISKLEVNIKKINDNITSGEIDSNYFNQLEDIREQLETKILSLKEQCVQFDLKKKDLVH